MTDNRWVRVSNRAEGDWSAECRLCGDWNSTDNATRIAAEVRFGRHLQVDHQERANLQSNEVGTSAPRGREELSRPDAEAMLSKLARRDVRIGSRVSVTRGPSSCPRCGSNLVMWGCDLAQQRTHAEIHPLAWSESEWMADTFICCSCWAGWIEPDDPMPITWVRPFWVIEAR